MQQTYKESYQLSTKLGEVLKARGLVVTTAESCTAGLLAAAITSIPGSSAYFDSGFIVYSDPAKQGILKVDQATIEKFGAVSEEVAKEMANGALKLSKASASAAITGIAGPTGGSEEKPVGTTCFAVSVVGMPDKAATMRFAGDRNSIREQAVKFALEFLLTCC